MPITEGGRFSPVDRIVSPGVFTRENDLSGLAQGVANIGAVIVGPFPKGPGFSPTLVESSADLESKFGVADGVYYGPYTAMEYLIEKGFVTVCRVGALTGYHQKFPFTIYAQKGTWERVGDVGQSVENKTFLTPVAGTFSDSWLGSFALDGVNPAGLTASVAFTFAEEAASGNWGTPSADDGSGSLLYNSDLENLGTVLFSVVSSSYGVGESFANAITGSTLTLIVLGTVSGLSEDSPFNGAEISGSVSMLTDVCDDPVFVFKGSVSGSFGPYNGEFTAQGSEPTFDPCTGIWDEKGAENKILAVLANTQYNPIDTNLEAAGFSGSYMTASSAVSESSTVGVEFNLSLKSTLSATPYGTYNFSLSPSSTKYITSVFGNDPTAGDPATYAAGTKIEAAYLYKVFENEIKAVVSEPTKWRVLGSALPSGSTFVGEAMEFKDEYSLDLNNGDSAFGLTNAYTPWVVSQEISPWNGGTPTRFDLFRLHTMTDGTDANTSYKIEISNVKLAGTVSGTDWGSFTLTVRTYSDSDRKTKILESFPNLNLDPDSSNYIARRIGDRYNYINFNGKILEFGTYDNNSRYIRVETTDIPWPVAAVPYGFREYATPINGAMGYWCPAMKYSKASVHGANPGKYPSGVVFDDAPTGADDELYGLYPTASALNGVSKDNKQYFAPLPEFESYKSVGRNVAFALDSEISAGGVGTGSYIENSNIVPAVYDALKETTYVRMRKFVFGFQGGFDGQSPAIPINVGGDIIAGNTQGLNCTNINSAGSIAYKQCVAALGNADEFDVNMIVTPGVIYQHHPYVVNLVVDMCEARGDCFYVLDLYVDDGNPSAGQIPEVIGLGNDFDTSYAGTYYPWVKIKDKNTNKYITVPPSVVMPAVYAANDRVAGEWWAAAGLNRGGIEQAKMVTDRTTHTERDELYENRINPIAAFPGQGIVVWGQKTLQVQASALDRINVRRLLIEIKKYFASTAKFLVFEQNTAATRNRFLALVNPYLQSIQQRSGLYAFDVVMDDTNNTPDLIDRNILYGQIYLQPTKTAEFIIFDFNILPTGAVFGSGA
jgi:hypothetical protein